MKKSKYKPTTFFGIPPQPVPELNPAFHTATVKAIREQQQEQDDDRRQLALLRSREGQL